MQAIPTTDCSKRPGPNNRPSPTRDSRTKDSNPNRIPIRTPSQGRSPSQTRNPSNRLRASRTRD